MRTNIVSLILLAWISQLNADQPAPMSVDRSAGATETSKSRADRGKYVLERPVKNLITGSPNSTQPLLISPSDPPGAKQSYDPRLEYVPKARIESSTKQLVNLTAAVEAAAQAAKTPDAALRLERVPMPRPDVGKGFIERPIEGLLVTPNGGAPIAAQPPAQFQADATPPPSDSPANEGDAALDAELDRRKKVIEAPVKSVVNDVPRADIESALEQALTQKPVGDLTKRKIIELPVTEIVADESAGDEQPKPEAAGKGAVASDKKPVDDNPRVEPGKVKWHASFDAAKEAAAKSGKPVLLFHLMGQLDQRFT